MFRCAVNCSVLAGGINMRCGSSWFSVSTYLTGCCVLLRVRNQSHRIRCTGIFRKTLGYIQFDTDWYVGISWFKWFRGCKGTWETTNMHYNPIIYIVIVHSVNAWFKMHCKCTAGLGRGFLLLSGVLQAVLLALRPSCLGLSSSAAGHLKRWGSHRSLRKRVGLGMWDSWRKEKREK